MTTWISTDLIVGPDLNEYCLFSDEEIRQYYSSGGYKGLYCKCHEEDGYLSVANDIAPVRTMDKVSGDIFYTYSPPFLDCTYSIETGKAAWRWVLLSEKLANFAY